MLPLALALLTACFNRAVAQEAAPTGLGHRFDGEWSLVWDHCTAPGGATISIQGGTISPYNAAYHAEKSLGACSAVMKLQIPGPGIDWPGTGRPALRARSGQ